MSDNEVKSEVPAGQGAGPVGIDSHPNFKRQPVAPRSIVPPRTTVAAITPEDLTQAVVAGLMAVQTAQEAKVKKEKRAADRQAKLPAAAQAAAAATGRKAGTPSLQALFIDDAIAGKFGEFAAEAKEETAMVRRWNNSFWELTYDLAGEAEAMDWLRHKFPDAVGVGKAVDCWKSLGRVLYKHHPFRAPAGDEEHVVFPLEDGYLHITKDRAWMESPDKKLALTFQVKTKGGVSIGKDFQSSSIPANSHFGRYLSSSLPDPELRALVQEQCAMSFLPNTHQSVAWWIGEGGAGKGTLSKLIEAFHHKIATLDLHKLSEPHHLEDLVDASLVRVDEVAQKGIWGEKEFKSMVSGDCVAINPKFKKNFTYRPRAYWIITTNQPPLIRDESDGVRRRIVPVPWSSSSRLRGSNIRNLDAMILKEESHLVLSWIVEGMQRYLRRGGPVETRDLPQPVKDLMTKIHRNNDNVEAWFEELEIMPAEGHYGFVHSKKEIYQSYVQFTEADGGNVLKEESFWIRFWRRPGLKTSGVQELKGTVNSPSGKVRVKQIHNLALTPQQVSQVKKDHLVADALARGSFLVEQQNIVCDDDPFGDSQPRIERQENRIPEFNPSELAELERLDHLATMRH
jgi:P4 family phage/plasmid primase-like protien